MPGSQISERGASQLLIVFLAGQAGVKLRELEKLHTGFSCYFSLALSAEGEE